ncbi:MAG: hypothetical protein KatS3mg059_1813 [Thermomicrobiales bacterium]|nr:MAG: hypothetical protein KatS3mg059_1813 [Thermomicrobiales bacterium]
MSTHDLLVAALEAAVPLHIIDMYNAGGPTDYDLHTAYAAAQELAERGDELLFRSDTRGRAAELFNRLARGIAILAFFPGGVMVFGRHWEASEIVQLYGGRGHDNNT